MTAAEYRSALTTLRLTQGRAARLLGIHPVTSNRWATGENGVSETAARFLRFLIAANISASTAVSILRIRHAAIEAPSTETERGANGKSRALSTRCESKLWRQDPHSPGANGGG